MSKWILIVFVVLGLLTGVSLLIRDHIRKVAVKREAYEAYRDSVDKRQWDAFMESCRYIAKCEVEYEAELEAKREANSVVWQGTGKDGEVLELRIYKEAK